MKRYERCDSTVAKMAVSLLQQPHHDALREADPKIDFLFAYGKRNPKTSDLIGDALRLHGVKALGIARIIPLKHRAMGRGDVEISLDGDWWPQAEVPDQKALLDHELFHFIPLEKTDDLNRPKFTMRPHSFDFGWFTTIAHVHGAASQEVKQAQSILDRAGQYFWPSLMNLSKEGTRFTHLEAHTKA